MRRHPLRFLKSSVVWTKELIAFVAVAIAFWAYSFYTSPKATGNWQADSTVNPGLVRTPNSSAPEKRQVDSVSTIPDDPSLTWRNEAASLPKSARFTLIEQICANQDKAYVLKFIQTLRVGDEQSFAIRESLKNCPLENLDTYFDVLMGEFGELYPDLFKEPIVDGVNVDQLGTLLTQVKNPLLRMRIIRSTAQGTEFSSPDDLENYRSTQIKDLSPSEGEQLLIELFDANLHLEPESYFKFAVASGFNPKNGSVDRAYHKWLAESPDAAIDFLVDSSPKELRDQIFPKAFSAWVRKYPVEASEKLNRMEPGALRDEGIGEVIQYLVTKNDLSSARVWADSITNQTKKLGMHAWLHSREN